MLHSKHAATTHPRIVIQSPDTDVAVLSVAHFEDLCCQELWFKTGIKDRQRYIPVHSILSSLARPLCNWLLPFHALTGCDSTSAFSGIGKKKAWKVMLRNEQIQRDLSSLGGSPAIQRRGGVRRAASHIRLPFPSYQASKLSSVYLEKNPSATSERPLGRRKWMEVRK